MKINVLVREDQTLLRLEKKQKKKKRKKKGVQERREVVHDWKDNPGQTSSPKQEWFMKNFWE